MRTFTHPCTRPHSELPPYVDNVRAETGLPVFDAISACDTFMSGVLDSKRYSLNNWRKDWDGEQEDYHYGDNLTDAEKEELVNKCD